MRLVGRRTFQTWGGCDIERCAVAVVVAASQFSDGIGLGMEDVRLCHIAIILTDVLKTTGGAIVAITDNHLVFNH